MRDLIDKALAVLPVERFRDPPPVVGVVRLAGVIGGMGPMRRGLSMARLAPVLERVFSLRRLEAVALAVNSPGGSPAQSALISDRIRALAAENEVEVWAFCEDVAASGGYWLATAADHVYALETSIVGSIGVVSGGFGFTDAIHKLGIERRLHTAGDKKAMLDPFRPEKPAEVKHLKAIQADIHDAFKARVRERRAGRLTVDDDELFSGAFWTGRRAEEMGLVDGIGDLRSVMRQRFGEKVQLKLVEERKSFLRGRLGLGAAAPDPGLWADAAISAVEERMAWNRFGL